MSYSPAHVYFIRGWDSALYAMGKTPSVDTDRVMSERMRGLPGADELREALKGPEPTIDNTPINGEGYALTSMRYLVTQALVKDFNDANKGVDVSPLLVTNGKELGKFLASVKAPYENRTIGDTELSARADKLYNLLAAAYREDHGTAMNNPGPNITALLKGVLAGTIPIN